MDDFEDAYFSDSSSSSDEEESIARRFCDRIATNLHLMMQQKPPLPLDTEILYPREVDYMELETLKELTPPPYVIEYVKDLNTFEMRECVVNPAKTDMAEVVDSISVHNWNRFLNKEPEIKHARFSFQDWEDIGSYCEKMCAACDVPITFKKVRSCIGKLCP